MQELIDRYEQEMVRIRQDVEYITNELRGSQ